MRTLALPRTLPVAVASAALALALLPAIAAAQSGEQRLGLGTPITHVPNPGYGFDAGGGRSGMAEGDAFGGAVAIVVSGTAEECVYAVGAPGADSTGSRGVAPSTPGPRGGALFLMSEGNKAVLARVGNPNPIDDQDRFGACVVSSGTFVFVGCPGGRQGASGPRGGIVYVVQADVGQGQSFGTIVLTIANPAPHDGDEFGASIAALADGTVLVGAPGRALAGLDDAGSVWALFAGGVAGLAFEIENPLPVAGDRFGAAVAGASLQGSPVIYVGAPSATDPNVSGLRGGLVYLLDGDPLSVSFGEEAGGSPFAPADFDDGTNHTPALLDGARFGAAVAAATDFFVVGSPLEDIDDAGVHPDAGFYYFSNGIEADSSRAPEGILDGGRTGAAIALAEVTGGGFGQGPGGDLLTIDLPLFPGEAGAVFLVGVPDHTIAVGSTQTGDDVIGLFPRTGAVIVASGSSSNGLAEEYLFVNPRPDDLDNAAPGGNDVPGTGDRFGAAVAIAKLPFEGFVPPTEASLPAFALPPDSTPFMIAVGAPLDDDFGDILLSIPATRDAGSVFVVSRDVINDPPVPDFECGAVQFAPATESLAPFVVLSGSDGDPDGDPIILWRADAYMPDEDFGNTAAREDEDKASFTWGGQLFGQNPFSYVLTDGNGNYGRGYGCVNVIKSPISASQHFTTVLSTETFKSIDISVLATDPDARALRFESLSPLGGSAGGSIAIAGGPSLEFTRSTFDARGEFSAGYGVAAPYRQGAVTDNGLGQPPTLLVEDTTLFADSTVFLLVNTPPDAGDIFVDVLEDEMLPVDVTAFVTDPDLARTNAFSALNQTLTYGVVSPGSAAAVLVSGTGTIEISSVTADTTVFYSAFDGFEEDTTARIFVNFVPVNDAPSAPQAQLEVDEDTLLLLADTSVFAAIFDEDDTTFTIDGATVTSGPGTVTRTGAATTYAPALDFDGTAFFQVEFTDANSSGATNGAQSGTQSIRVVVRPVNDAPFFDGFDPDTTVFILEDTTLFFADADLLSQIADVDDTTFDVALGAVSGALPGTATHSTATAGTRFTPAANAFGDKRIEVTATDRNSAGRAPASPGALSVTKVVNLRVLPVNDAPVCADLAFTIPADTTVGADVTDDLPGTSDPIITDVDSAQFFLTAIGGTGVTLTAAGRVKTPHGTVTFEEGGARFTYTPDAGFAGDDEFTYTVVDGLQAVGTAVGPDLAPREGTGRVTISVIEGAPAPAAGDFAVRGGGRIFQGCAAGPEGAMNMAHVLGAMLALLAARARRRKV